MDQKAGFYIGIIQYCGILSICNNKNLPGYGIIQGAGSFAARNQPARRAGLIHIPEGKMTDIIIGIANSLTMVKGMYEIAKQSNSSILIKQISDLNIQLSQIQDFANLMHNENRELKAQLQEDTDNPLSISQCGIYFDTNKNRYCAGCYDGPTRRRVHLTYQYAGQDYIKYSCPVCNTEYIDKSNIGFVNSHPRKTGWNPLDY